MTDTENNNKEALLKAVCCAIFLLYAILLIKVIMFKYIDFTFFVSEVIDGNIGGFRSVNLIPVKSIIEFTEMLFTGRFTIGFNNLAGNILLFVPLGYFTPLLIKKCRKMMAVIFSSFLISLIFEVFQYFLYLGSADVDDIILNTLGGAAGYVIYKLAVKYAKAKYSYKSITAIYTAIYTATIALSGVGFAAAAVIGMDYFEVFF